ncbi:MAG: DUF1311 domain-containing protein [Alphaproteobacteria bacterium]|nr:MAG: DUF1311 domain-containing protein [Alphaproteobacteria bacterium]
MIVALMLAMAAPAPAADPCKGSSTPEINACISGSLARAQARLDKYVDAAKERCGSEDEAAVRLGIEASQKAFDAYREIECAAVYEDWKDGTIRGAMHLSCEVRLTDERTHTVWQNWLQYMDSTPPILPEPKPTE